MKVAICDEDKECSVLLYGLVKRQEPDSEVFRFYSVRQFLESGQHYDIMLLDIGMEDMRGIEAARALRINGADTVLISVPIFFKSCTYFCHFHLYLSAETCVRGKIL